MSIAFKASDHSYVSIDDTDIQWISVTSLVSNFKEPFDAEATVQKVSKNKKSKWYGLTPQEILEVWNSEGKRATDLGTFYHNQREADLCSLASLEKNGYTLPVYTPIEKDGLKYAPLQKLEPGVYPEHMVYLKSAGICGQSDLVEVIGDEIYIIDYKGLALDTLIPTKNGFKKMEDIQVGDKIFDGEGYETIVEHVSSIHYNPCYNLIFDTKEEIIADHEHKWVILKRLAKDKYIEIEKTTEQLFELLQQGKKLRIKLTQLKGNNIDLPIDPYILGLWLGDGSAQTGTITNMSTEIWQEIQNRGYEVSESLNPHSGKAQTKTLYGLRSQLKKLNLLNNKHIPLEYLRASKEQRLDLLRGFMDADGSYNKLRNRFIMVTTKEWQAKDLKALVNSLGWKANIIKAKASGFGKTNIDSFHVGFVADENPFLVRNQHLKVKLSSVSKFRYIKSINKIDTVPTKCLSVTSSTHTYLATESYIKTHNTNKEIKTESYVNWEGISKKMLFPVNNLDDCSFNHYALQLSVYMFIMLKHNPKLKPGKMFLHHVLFEQEGEDKYGYPIYKYTPEGDPIVKEVIPIEVPYLKEEVLSIITWLKDNRHLLKKK